jgi:uncharacterized membrane protein
LPEPLPKVLRTIRQGIPEINSQLQVPHSSVAVAVVLAMASLGVLIYFIHSISAMIQVEHIIATGASLIRRLTGSARKRSTMGLLT